ncbi:MAG: PP2C family protein-serine/threonine phosphatase [Bacteroidales bacterium]|nr:PP2C family protein-serine/threonine phosphatase [Bacteroidales bacterium]
MAIVDLIRQKFELADFKLKTLLEITMAINANSSASELLQRYRGILCDDFGIGCLATFVCNQNWKKVVSVGIPDDLGNNADEVSSALLLFKDVTDIRDREESLFKPFDLVVPVYHKNTPLAFVLIGNVSSNKSIFGENPLQENLDAIQILSNVIVVALENKRLYKKALEQESLKKELEVASRLQAMLIPAENSLPENSFVKISSYYHPHSMVGGDYYDFMQLNESEYGFCIADVSGKGISAAILMSNIQANLRILFKKNVPLTNLIKELNQNVNKNSQGDRFVTFFIGQYNGATKILHYINAGHNPPFLLKKETSELLSLTSGCVGLGMLDEIPSITVGTVNINSGDKLICYTDGLTESENSAGEAFGTVPIENLMKKDISAATTVSQLCSELEQFIESNMANDDVSIMGIDFL